MLLSFSGEKRLCIPAKKKKKTVGRDVEFIGPILDLKKQNINKPPLENRMFFSFNSQVIHSFIFGRLWLPLPAVIE